MIKKYVIFIGLFGYYFFNSASGGDYSDFLTRNCLVLSESQKNVYNLLIDDWTWFLKMKPEFYYDSCSERDQKKLAFLFVLRNYNQSVICTLSIDKEKCQTACVSRKEEMQRQYGENVQICDDWYYNRYRIETDFLKENIEKLSVQNRLIWYEILAVATKNSKK